MRIRGSCIVTLGLTVLVLALAIGCSSSAGNGTTMPSSSATAHPSGAPADTPSPVPSTSATSSARVVNVDQSRNGQSVTLTRGDELHVVLNSTLWTFSEDVKPEVLGRIAGPQADTAGDCPPGVGCGTVTVTYRALEVGQAEVDATRTLCGEAFQCSPDETSFRILVTVVSP